MGGKLFITGAQSAIGQELARACVRQRVDFCAGYAPWHDVPLDTPAVRMDFADRGSLTDALAGSSTVISIVPTVPQQNTYLANLIAACRDAGVNHIIHLSGYGARFGTPFAMFTLKAELEAMIVSGGISYTIIRANAFMQNFVTHYAPYMGRKRFNFFHTEGEISFVDVRDVSDVLMRIASEVTTYHNQVLDSTGPEALTHRNVVERINTICGTSYRYAGYPFIIARPVMRYAKGMSPWEIDWITSIARAAHAGELAGVSATVARITGRSPRTIDRFISDTERQLRAQFERP